MLSETDIQDFFAKLQLLGCKAPVWPTPEAGVEAIRLYTLLLADLTPADLLRALVILGRQRRTADFQRPFPDPGQVLALLDDRPPVEAEADAAWRALLDRVRRNPMTAPERGPSPVRQALWAGIGALGGWEALVGTLPERPTDEARTFRAAFTAELRRHRAEREREVVDGICRDGFGVTSLPAPGKAPLRIVRPGEGA